jgi:RNase P subunit RPR2
MPGNFYTFEVRKTKIKRICQECSTIIRKKQSYYRGVGRKNGTFNVKILCCSCGAKEQSEMEVEKIGEYRVFRDYYKL